jgi:uncharacterized protein YgiM (DUF1202 family)
MRKNSALGIVLLILLSTNVWAQQAAAKRNLVVRRDPSKSSPALDHVAKDDRLTLVSGSAENGHYHVKTEDDVIGWVLATGITVSPSPGTAPTHAPATATERTMRQHFVVSRLPPGPFDRSPANIGMDRAREACVRSS